jgi:sugar (pentulose or hexulose) kinase
MGEDILAVDVGTSRFKLAVYGPDLKQKCQVVHPYEVNVYGRAFADLEPEKWWATLRRSCAEVAEHLRGIEVVSLSVTTPGLTPMAADGTALGPAILFFDGRSHSQAREIRARVGNQHFLEEACNLPVSGGSSLCSIMWIRDSQPDVWAQTARFGHTNTYMVKRLTGEWAIDPSTVSITGLYNTARHDLNWNDHVLAAAGIPANKLPPLLHSHQVAGAVLPDVARELGLPKGCRVLVGGNDAVLAALSAGVTESGQICSVVGTVEITSVCVDHPVASADFNVRCHVVPDRWLTFFVLNAGGKSFEWFKSVFCAEMSDRQFYDEYVPGVLRRFFDAPDPTQAEEHLPVYGPFLGGSRYSLERLTGSFSGLDLETTRDEMLLALIRGNATYSGSHLRDVGRRVKLGSRVIITGTGAKVGEYARARRRWFGDYEYVFQEQSSLMGAAMLGQRELTGAFPVVEPELPAAHTGAAR